MNMGDTVDPATMGGMGDQPNMGDMNMGDTVDPATMGGMGDQPNMGDMNMGDTVDPATMGGMGEKPYDPLNMGGGEQHDCADDGFVTCADGTCMDKLEHCSENMKDIDHGPAWGEPGHCEHNGDVTCKDGECMHKLEHCKENMKDMDHKEECDHQYCKTTC